MATGKITKRAVDAMRAGSRNDFLWDTETKGFGVKITPAGKRVYILQYRLGGAGTKTQRYTIGAHGTWTPDAAEREAKRLLALVDQGKDRSEEHTSELQSLMRISYACFCLKKKTQNET